MKRELRPHQTEALKKLRSGTVLCGGVGTGKSFVSVMYYLTSQAPKDIYVITTAKKRDTLDWNREFANVGISTLAGHTSAGVLTVDSWNNISKYKRVKNAFFIFDEQRLVGSGSWVKNFLSITKRNTWLLLSATPGDSWLDYIPVFVANGFYPNRTAFKAEHVVYKPYMKFPVVSHFLGTSKLTRLRNSILVPMPYERHTTRHLIEIPCAFSSDLTKQVIKTRWEPFKNEPIRGAAEFYNVLRKVANSDPSRLSAVQDLVTKVPRLIVFYNFNYELEVLRTLEGKPIAEWNGHKHELIPDSDEWIYLVQYTAGAEGWECIATDSMIFYSLPYSYKQWEQAFGRIDRLNTPFKNLYYYMLISKSVVDLSIRRSLRAKKDFNMHDMSGFRSD